MYVHDTLCSGVVGGAETDPLGADDDSRSELNCGSWLNDVYCSVPGGMTVDVAFCRSFFNSKFRKWGINTVFWCHSTINREK
jgi:hypothetical protein